MVKVKKHLKKARISRLKQHKLLQAVIILLVVAIGAFVLLKIHAVTSTASFEAEDGSLSGSAAGIADTKASGGHAVVFQGASSNPNNIAIDPPTGTFPIPKTGLYWGGIEKDQVAYGTVPGCTTTAWPEVECKMTWAATQTYPATTAVAGQGGTQVNPTNAVMSSDGTYHASLDHYFYTGCGASAGSDFNAGGRLYAAAHTPGRKVLLIDVKCGSTWSTIGHGGGNTTEDQQLKTFATKLNAVGLPVIMSIYNEPENDICEQSTEGTPDDFRAMFRQASADIRSQHLPNVAIALTLQGADVAYWAQNGRNNNNTVFTGCSMTSRLAAERNPNNFYPGDDALDFLTFQEYDHNKGDFATSYQVQLDWIHTPCPTSHPTTNYDCTSAVREAKPTGSSEWGISGPKDFRDTYFTNMITELPKMPQIKYLAYWSSQDQPPNPDWVDYPYQIADPLYRNADGTWGHPDYGTDTTHTSLKAWTTLSLSPYVYKPTF